ncbi:hypothetical protein [Egicoccus sp. AB-alg2]|uniref:hypothetical protein n=1 Tax=Egicoccus sp. AB-alg2 TaxID=3242693 RepID=UPI00359E5A04
MREVFGQAGVLVAIGLVTLGLATALAVREPTVGPGRQPPPAAPLVPWLGSALAVVLAVRGSFLAAGVLLLGTLVYTVRVRCLLTRRHPPHRRRR